MLTGSQQLKLSLFAEGISVSPLAREMLSGGRSGQALTLADYASTSGIALVLDDNIWVNAPIRDFNPNFVSEPPHVLDFADGEYVVRSRNFEVQARPVPLPAYYDKLDSCGRSYVSYGLTHTDRVRISPVEGCVAGCLFCDMTYKYQYRTKSLEGLVNMVRVALEDPILPAKHILISGGTPCEEDFPYLNRVYEAVPAAFPGVEVDVMMSPMPGLLDVRLLHSWGVHGMAVNLEVYDEALSRSLMPLKGALARKGWFDFIERAVDTFGPGRIRSLLMVGIEPVENTVLGVQALAQRGCEPVLSPFRPDPATPLSGFPPPSAAILGEAYERSSEMAARYGAKLGPRCVPCQHNTVTFPDGSGYYVRH